MLFHPIFSALLQLVGLDIVLFMDRQSDILSVLSFPTELCRIITSYVLIKWDDFVNQVTDAFKPLKIYRDFEYIRVWYNSYCVPWKTDKNVNIQEFTDHWKRLSTKSEFRSIETKERAEALVNVGKVFASTVSLDIYPPITFCCSDITDKTANFWFAENLVDSLPHHLTQTNCGTILIQIR
jgi:hypothetical protein